MEQKARLLSSLASAPLDHLDAAQAFSALGSEARLEVLRALVRAGPGGLPVGALQDRIGIAASTLSHHLKSLAQCGLLEQRRDGRSLICRANFQRIEQLSAYLLRECCAEDAATPPCADVAKERRERP